MIPLDPRQHRAEVRPDGSIVLPGIDAISRKESSEEPSHTEDSFVTLPQLESTILWEVTTKEEAESPVVQYTEQQTAEVESAKPSIEHQRSIDPTEAIALLKSGQLAAYRAAMSLLQESANQYRVSAKDIRGAITRSRAGLADSGTALWAFLTQPVWIVRKNAEPRKYSRGTLFVLDTVRFGGTFAALFTAIFLTLNYQSFWEIVRSNIRPIHSVQNEQMLVSTVDEALRNKLMKSPTLAVAGRNAGDLLSFLPEVGPPDNRIIIPKLNLNVPLVTPSYQNLLQENWAGVEEDIQSSLQHGVVHYPGTARPGQAGNFFVTGHSSYYPWAPGKYKNVFARLHEVDVGDEYWVYYGGDRHRYRVVEKKEVKPSDVTVLDQPLSHRTATLMTCTPVGTTLRRLIITSQEIDPVTGIALDVGEHGERTQQKLNVEQLPI